MKKLLQRFVCAALVFCLAAGFAPLKAQAAEQYHTTVHSLSKGEWVRAKGAQDSSKYDMVYHVYKFKVTSSVGYTRIFIDRSKDEFLKTRPILMDKCPRNEIAFMADNILELTDGKNYITLPKGTYYIYANKNVRLKWEFTKKSVHKNTSKSKAESLSAGKELTVFYPFGHEAARWYKVKLSSSHKIEVTDRCKDLSYAPVVTIVDKNGKPVKATLIDGDGYDKWRTDRLPKGTYYIRLARSSNYVDGKKDLDGRIVVLKWVKK